MPIVIASMARALLSLAYRVFRSPFAAWALLAITIVTVLTALLKLVVGATIPAALGPDAFRSFFQLAPFTFIPLSVYLALSEFRLRYMLEERHRITRWPMARCIGALVIWLVLLFVLFGFNLAVFPKA
jgi:hypothetical protein